MNLRLPLQLHGLVEGLADQVERRKVWFLAGFSLLYFAITCLLASYKLLWNDELYTLYISRPASLSGVWAALLTGAEQLPPLFYVITRASLALFGANELAIRLPEVIGFWVMSVCLFRFVSRRAPAVYGLLAMLFPLVTGAYYYAYEARPYALVLGFGALALLCWQSATEKGNPMLPLTGLALSLAAAVSCHYYAVFILLPLAFGEAVRSLSLRRINWAVWLALGMGATPLVGFLPLIQRAKAYSSIFWGKPAWMSIPNFYIFLLAPAILPLVTMLVLAALYPAAYGLRRRGHRAYTAPPLHEVAVAFGFMVIPVITVTLAKLVTGAFTDRYALPAVIGFSVIVAFGAYSLLHDRAPLAAILTLSLCGFFLAIGERSLSAHVTVRKVRTQADKLLTAEGLSDLPIAVADQHAFMILTYYGSPDIVPRLVYLASPSASIRHLGHSSVEKGLLDLRPWFPVKVEEYETFIASKKPFLVYGSASNSLNWLFSELTTADLRIELLGRRDDTFLFLVTPKSETPAASHTAGM